jgi:hypothetical protein
MDLVKLREHDGMVAQVDTCNIGKLRTRRESLG